MSRTDKDVHSERALFFEAVRNGYVDHDHRKLGEKSVYKRPRRDLSGEFFKRDTKGINRWREYLEQLIKDGEPLIYEERPVVLEKYWFELERRNVYIDEHYPLTKNYQLKKIEFVVYETFTKKYSEHCFDINHCDPETMIDDRDGGYVLCEPALREEDAHRGWYYRSKSSKNRVVTPRASIRTSLRKVQADYNTSAGELFEDDYYEIPAIINTYAGPPIWD